MSRHRSQGFTLIETMAVVTIIGIMVVLGYSNMSAMMQRQDFNSAVSSINDVFLNARFYAIRTGTSVGVTLEGSAVIAFIDANNDFSYNPGELVVARYPDAPDSVLPANITVDCMTFRERGSGPRTAFFDGRGFYVDKHDNTSRHGANVCISDSFTGRQKTLSITPFGNVNVGANQCDPSPFICPNVAPP